MTVSNRSRPRRRQPDPGAGQKTDTIEILVLDQERETLERLENALWTWPHKFTNARSVEDAVAICHHVKPTALIADIKFAGDSIGAAITALRRQLPDVPIVALGSRFENLSPGRISEIGADAFLAREELHRPTLHNLLQTIQRRAGSSVFAAAIQIPMPWRESKMIGALICDESGKILIANDCLAAWLQYPDGTAMMGKRVWPDILDSHADWSAWTGIVGGKSALLHQSATIKTKDGQRRSMTLEIFAAQGPPGYLQAVFVDRTEDEAGGSEDG